MGEIGESQNRTQDQGTGEGIRTGLRVRTPGEGRGTQQDSGSGPLGTQDQCTTGVQSRDQDQSRNQNFPDTVGSWLDCGGRIQFKKLGPVESVL